MKKITLFASSFIYWRMMVFDSDGGMSRLSAPLGARRPLYRHTLKGQTRSRVESRFSMALRGDLSPNTMDTQTEGRQFQKTATERQRAGRGGTTD